MALLGHSGSHAPQLIQSEVIIVAMDAPCPFYLFSVITFFIYDCQILKYTRRPCYGYRRGGVPKWLRERSAKPRCSGSNPLATSKLCLKSLAIPNPRPLLTKKMFRFCSNFSGETALIACFNSSETVPA